MDENLDLKHEQLEQSLDNLKSDFTETDSEYVYNNRAKQSREKGITPMPPSIENDLKESEG